MNEDLLITGDTPAAEDFVFPPETADPGDQASPIYKNVLTWLLMISFIFLAVRGTFSFQAGPESNFSSLSATMDRGLVGNLILPGVAYAIMLCLVILSLREVLHMAGQMKATTLLALMTMCSALWSQDPMRSLSHGALYLLEMLFAFYLIDRFRTEDIMSLVTLAGVLICVLDIAFVLFLPHYGIGTSEGRKAGSWRGMFAMSTSAGLCLTYLLSPALVFGYRRLTVARLAYIALVLTSIAMTRSASALIVLSLYAVFMFVLHLFRHLERRAALAMGLGFFMVAALAVVSSGALYARELTSFFGRDLTLTGRTEIWAVLLSSIAKHPWFGYGYYAFWLGLTGESANVITAMHWLFGYAHNGFLEVALQLGLVGLALFLVTLLQAGKNGWRYLGGTRSLGGDWLIGLIVMTILYNIDEETFLWPVDLLSILYVVACCGLFRKAQESALPPGDDVFEALDEPVEDAVPALIE